MTNSEAFLASVLLFGIVYILIKYSWRLTKGIIKECIK